MPIEGISAGEPRVFTVPPGAPFLVTLADALLSGTLVGPIGQAELGEATIYLPTRRAGRALASILAERAGGGALLLPRIVPLGDADEPAVDVAVADDDLAPALEPLERRLILTRLVQAWAASVDRDLLRLGPDVPFLVPGSPADAVALAGDLEALMDSLAAETVEWDALADVVDVEHSRYFRLTLDFVRIAHTAWPGILADRGATDPVRRRNAALEREVARLAAAPPAGAVIAAGSTGSMPATARLLAAVARLPRGAVVLPGLDLQLDEAAWDAIDSHGHPQFLLRRLLGEHLGLKREAVQSLGTGASARERLASEVMRPAETTDSWSAMTAESRASLALAGTDGMALIEAADEREEALAVAIALRETLAKPGRNAALITPDRALARRVAAELGRWGVAVEDSAGRPLTDTPAGRLARLAAEAAALDFHPVQVLALLAHPDVTLGLDRPTLERGAAALEIGALRGPAPRPGLDGLAAAVRARREARGRRDPLPRKLLTDRDWDLAADLIRRLDAAFRNFRPGERIGEAFDLVDLARRHEAALAALTAPPARADPPPPSPAAEALAALFDGLAAVRVGDGAGATLKGRFSEYPAFFAALARDRTVPPDDAATHPRVKILGLLEARLLAADRVVLGGLDETIWPPAAETDAFLNRPMRIKLGLSPPERRIGQTAHDLVQALGTRDAILTRARKRDGKPTVPSRVLERLRAFAGDEVWTSLVARGDRYRGLALALDRPRPVAALARPAPKPGGARFPRRLSVTEIETLVRDPYAIFARHILRLDPLDSIATPPSPAERGSILHGILASFAGAHPDALPANAAELLHQIGLDAFAPIAEAYPELYALWWPAFARMVPAFLEWERERRAGIAALRVETAGALDIPIAEGDVFRLTARADRIESLRDGGATIVDYKSGTVPKWKVIAVGFSPQLTLEAAMLMNAGFKDAPRAAKTPELEYVKIGGRLVLERCQVKPSKGDTRNLDEVIDKHLDGLKTLVGRYARDDVGYVSRPYVQYALRYAPYDHLARVAEWSIAGDAEEEVGP